MSSSARQRSTRPSPLLSPRPRLRPPLTLPSPARRLVLDTLQKAHKTAPERKCFRLVGGVLVERTVQDVLPQLEGQFDQLKTVLETLTAQYKTKVRHLHRQEVVLCSSCVCSSADLTVASLCVQESAFGQFQRDNNSASPLFSSLSTPERAD